MILGLLLGLLTSVDPPRHLTGITINDADMLVRPFVRIEVMVRSGFTWQDEVVTE